MSDQSTSHDSREAGPSAGRTMLEQHTVIRKHKPHLLRARQRCSFPEAVITERCRVTFHQIPTVLFLHRFEHRIFSFAQRIWQQIHSLLFKLRAHVGITVLLD